MPIFLRVRLTESEHEELLQLQKVSNISERTRRRIEILLLSNQGLSVKQISECVKQKEAGIRRTINRWFDLGQKGLFDEPRQGRPRKWKEEDIEYLENILETEERTYNSHQLAKKLKDEKNVDLSSQRIRKILKKKDWRWKRTRTSLKGKQNPQDKLIKKADLETLKAYEQQGLIKLKYADESGFCLWSPVSYTYAKKGIQKETRQSKRRGKRISILGFFEKDKSFDYGLKQGGFKSKTYIDMMNWQAEKAESNFKKTGQITVIVLDNCKIHKSKEVQKYLEDWREKGLELFFISAYSPELNIIEVEWHQIKEHELCGRMFDDEYDLAIAVMDGVEKRQSNKNMIIERFRFN
jgi:transposase